MTLILSSKNVFFGFSTFLLISPLYELYENILQNQRAVEQRARMRAPNHVGAKHTWL